MWQQFILENIHFSIYILASFVFFATFWLYLDAFVQRKSFRELIKLIGFLMLSLSYAIQATVIESTSTHPYVFLRIISLFLILSSIILEPLQKRPQYATPNSLKALTFVPASAITLIYPLLTGLVGVFYLRRATIGLENHVKKIAFSFYILSLAEIFDVASFLKFSDQSYLYSYVASYGLFWNLKHLFLLGAVVILGSWVVYYLTKRIQSQLFITFVLTSLIIFLVVTISFTAILVKDLENDTLNKLRSDVKVLEYSFESKKAESLSDSQLIGQDTKLQSAIVSDNKQELQKIVSNFLLTKKQSSVLVLNSDAKVLERGEDSDKIGDSLSGDHLIKKVLESGESFSSVDSKSGSLVPQVLIRSATPIKKDNEIIGAVVVANVLDNAFVDNLKSSTGFTSSIYAKDVIAATTLTTGDNKNRPLGMKEENSKITDEVLGRGQPFSGSVTYFNIPYFGSFVPLKNIDGESVGMLVVAKQQTSVLETASKSIQTTFIAIAFLIVLSLIPAYLISRYIGKQIQPI